LVPVMPMDPVVLKKGDIFCHVGAGGGGYGDPLTRDPQACLADYIEELFTADYIDEVYGVVITQGGQPSVDEAATQALRAGRRTEQTAPANPASLRRFLESFGVHTYSRESPRQLNIDQGAGNAQHNI